MKEGSASPLKRLMAAGAIVGDAGVEGAKEKDWGHLNLYPENRWLNPFF